MHSKASSSIESIRKPLSRAAAAATIAIAILTIPKTFGTNLGESMEIAGFALLIIAALGRVWCSIYISGRKDRVLCVDGPYQLTRNPLYFFSFLGIIGFAMALQSVLILLVASGAYLAYYRYVIRSEESRLASIFGASYVSYCTATPRFFPAFKTPDRIESYSINPRIVERALKEVVWFLFAILAIEVVEMIHAKGHLVLLKLPL